VFFLKKLVSAMLMPVTITFFLLLAGSLMAWSRHRARTGRIIITITSVILILLGYGAGTGTILEKLEYAYPVLDLKQARTDSVQWVIVLGGGHISDSRLPVGSQLSWEAQMRLVEGIRIHRNLPGSRLLFSGGKLGEPVSNAELMSRMAQGLGVDPNHIVLEDRSRDTKDEARIIKGMIGSAPCILVTSAYHMPRSMALFAGQGIHPLPAPVGHLTHRHERWRTDSFFPNARHLEKAELVLHELLGMASAWIMHQI